MNSVFSISKLDNINLRKYKITQKALKKDIKKLVDILLNLPELKKSRVFCPEISKVRFEISFCTNETIKKINSKYRSKNKPTDVITFSLFYDDENSFIYRKTADLGQIIISIEKAYEQGEDLRLEILTLIAHGILHLFGFDHLEKKDYDFVVGIQKKVIKEL